MRTKAKMMLLTAILTAALLGCGQDAKVIEGEVKNASDEAKENPEAEDTQDAADAETEKESEEAAEYKGYAFIYQDVVIEMDADAAPIVEKLGEANSYFEAPSCAFEGIDKMYTYGSFELDTYPMENKDYVSAVIFKDDAIATPEGVGVGDTAEKMTEIYGEGTLENGMTVYEKDGMKLCFILQEESIVSIEYRSTVLDE